MAGKGIKTVAGLEMKTCFILAAVLCLCVNFISAAPEFRIERNQNYHDNQQKKRGLLEGAVGAAIDPCLMAKRGLEGPLGGCRGFRIQRNQNYHDNQQKKRGLLEGPVGAGLGGHPIHPLGGRVDILGGALGASGRILGDSPLGGKTTMEEGNELAKCKKENKKIRKELRILKELRRRDILLEEELLRK